jgi:hypothetical protein
MTRGRRTFAPNICLGDEARWFSECQLKSPQGTHEEGRRATEKKRAQKGDSTKSHHQTWTRTANSLFGSRFIKIDFGIFAFFVRISFGRGSPRGSPFCVCSPRGALDSPSRPLDAGIDFILPPRSSQLVLIAIIFFHLSIRAGREEAGTGLVGNDGWLRLRGAWAAVLGSGS